MPQSGHPDIRASRAVGAPRRVGAGRRVLAERRSAVPADLAAIALSFLVLLGGTAELSFDIFAQSALNFAANQAAREVWIGGVQGRMSSAAFVGAAVCPFVNGILDCARIVANVAPAPRNFWLDRPPAYQDASALTVDRWRVCTGGPGTPIMLQLVYAGPTLIGSFVPGFAKLYRGEPVHPIEATVAVVNQFTFAPTASC